MGEVSLGLGCKYNRQGAFLDVFTLLRVAGRFPLEVIPLNLTHALSYKKAVQYIVYLNR